MVRYAIVDRDCRVGDAARLAAHGVDIIQLRDKSLPARELAVLARQILVEMRPLRAKHKLPRLLINGRADVAVAAGADGVHLTAHADELTPAQVRAVFAEAGAPPPVVSVSCHTLADVERARDAGADWLLFAPVFEKRIHGALVAEGAGLAALRAACAAAPGRVLAMGGVTRENADACMRAGAAGIAGIRMFA